jgi:hypothetical protein
MDENNFCYAATTDWESVQLQQKSFNLVGIKAFWLDWQESRSDSRGIQ